MSLSDGELVRRVIAREQTATRQFVDTYAPIIQSAAARVLSRYSQTGVRRVPDVADVVQDIFRLLWDREFTCLRGYEEQRGTLAAFLWTLSKNETSKIAKSGRRSGYREVPKNPLATSAAEGRIEPERAASGVASQIEDKDALEVIFAELADELDANDRRLIKLRFVDEQPNELICAELRISPAAYYQRVSRLRRLIHQTAVRHGIAPDTP